MVTKHTCTHTHMRTHTNTHTHAHAHTQTHTHTYTHTHMQVELELKQHKHTHTQTHTHTHTHTHMQVELELKQHKQREQNQPHSLQQIPTTELHPHHDLDQACHAGGSTSTANSHSEVTSNQHPFKAAEQQQQQQQQQQCNSPTFDPIVERTTSYITPTTQISN